MTLPSPTPKVIPETATFWEEASHHRLSTQVCGDCGLRIWYPRSLCPSCWSRNLSWVECSGRGEIYSYTIVSRTVGDYAEATPYVLAYVELEEGPRILTNISDPTPETLAVGAPVRAVFDAAGEGTALVRFVLD